MRSTTFKSALIKSRLAATLLLLASGASYAQQAVNLTAASSTVAMPDGTSVPMWGYSCGVVDVTSTATCAKLNPTATGWSPVIITVPAGAAGGLSINLTNSLKVPTSITIVGQLGGGLGTTATSTPSPNHPVQSTTWFAVDPTVTNTPPKQGARVQSFATEVAAGAVTPTTLTWATLRPGTYLIESGTHPSIQGPMGLYGILVVTTAPAGTTAGTAYPGVTYNAEVPLLLSEIDPVQNNAVSAAVNAAFFSETLVWSGLVGGCGNPAYVVSASTPACYPPAVNYTPLYYLFNGVAFNRASAGTSLFSAAAGTATTGITGNVLVRLVNAGLRMHVPSIVGAQTTPAIVPTGVTAAAVPGISLVAEDGNPLPGVTRVQNEVFLAAGKTYDVMIDAPATVGTALPIFDRELSLSGNATARDAGMLAYIGVNGAGVPAAPALTGAVANPDAYNAVIAGQTLTVSDPSKGVIRNDVNISGVQVVPGSVTGGILTLNTNGTFTFAATAASGSFRYCGNGVLDAATPPAQCTDVTLGGATLEAGTAITCGTSSYTSTLATTLSIKPSGILATCKSAAGYPLTVDTTSIVATSGVTITADPNGDGGFTATVGAHPGVPATGSFTFNAKNSQGVVSATTGTVNLTFPAASGLAVTVLDGKDKTTAVNDYRWIIEEDRTFYINPNTTTTTCSVTTVPCPPANVIVPKTFGTNFHTSYMPLIAQGCTGPTSCETGQSVQTVASVCDIGNGVCQPGTAKAIVMPGQVVLDPTKRYYLSILPGDAQDDPGPSHAMGGAEIAAGQTTVTVLVEPTPLPTAKVSVFVFEDDHPLNGEHDAGGGIDVLAPNEPGLGGFNITLFDDVGGPGDAAGQMTYDMFNMPLSNALAGTIDPTTGLDACPVSHGVPEGTSGPLNPRAGFDGVVGDSGITGVIPVCPTLEADGITQSPLAGQAVVAYLPPGRYGVVATPGADRITKGEEWLQTNTLDGGKAHDSFVKASEPGFFQEYGPAGYHVAVGFADEKIINSRHDGVCGVGTLSPVNCTRTVTGHVTLAHMSRTPDERLYGSGTRDAFGYTRCYVSLGGPDDADFVFSQCDDQGNFTLSGIPQGDWRITIFDQWNDQIVDGITTPVRVGSALTTDMGEVAVHQWKTNVSTRTFIDLNGDGVSQDSEPGVPLASTNIRFRDGSFSNFNNTDLTGAAGFNEIFPLFNWYTIETTSTRYKNTGTHVVYDAGGPVDGGAGCGGTNQVPCKSSSIAANIARTAEAIPLPANLRVPGAFYCANADCTDAPAPLAAGGSGGSTGRVDPPWVVSEGWQGFIGQTEFFEFGKKPFAPHENGGIQGHVVYASTRPFDDPALLLQLSWEPLVPHVTINLYKEGLAADGVTRTLTLVDHTQTSSWDDWAQGFRTDNIPNMNCPGQGRDTGTNADLFFFTLRDQPNFLNPGTALPNNSQFKCYDGMHSFNQAQPAPYDGMYAFPSVTSIDPATGKPAGTNCTGCTTNPDTSDPYRAGLPMLPAGKYVVEMIVPPGYELVKEEDKNILLGDTYIAPVTQQFAGAGNIFIMPDQAAVNAAYNANNALIPTTNFGSPRNEGDTGSVETFWPCVGAARVVPDWMSIYPLAGQNAPFAGATRNLCDRKEVTLNEEMTVLAKFYVFTSTHVAAHFTGQITDDFTSEFDPFSPAFGEKSAPPNLPIGIRDWAGNEVNRVYADQWGVYNGLNYSSYGVNPPDPSGYVPTMMVTCMNDAGDPLHPDPLYNPSYSQFCYEIPFMPGQTQYMDTPVVPTSAFAGSGYNNPDCAYPDTTPAISEVDGDGAGPWISAPGTAHPINIYALGDKQVNNYGYSGPSATASPYNQKTVTRHYGFGAAQGSGTVKIGGVTATVTSWSDQQITVTLPATGTQVSACALQQQAQYGGSNALCGEVVVTAGNGKQSIDTVTMTIGGKAPTHVAASASIQDAIDLAKPGDLIIVDPLTRATATTPAVASVHSELVLMWKPVQLQGVAAASAIISASAHPAGVLDPWRAKVICLFGLSVNGQPYKPSSLTDPGNPFDPSGKYSCGNTNGTGWYGFNGGYDNPQVDRLPLEGILGWTAQTNGNLAEQLQEPTLLGAYEGAGITVVGKGVRYPLNAKFIFGNGPDNGNVATAGQFPTGTNLLTNSSIDCTTGAGGKGGTGYTSNFLCNPSRIDGLTVTNSSQGGGGILVHAWGHKLEISNNRVYNNAGTLSGGISVGIGETPDALLAGNNGDPLAPTGGFDQQPWTCRTGFVSGAGTLTPIQNASVIGVADGTQLPFCYDRDVAVHNNAVTQNLSIGDELFSATPAGSGGVTFCPGADGYKLTGNWICGNLATGDGGGVTHLGHIENGLIEHNQILFNQTTNPTVPTNGGGIIVMTTAPDGLDPTLSLAECGAVTDVDCAPGLGEGTGPGLVINANLILGNAADSGSGGGLRLQGVSGDEVSRFPLTPGAWYGVMVTNNIIANNVAGWDGAGVSLHDTLKASLINNTIVSNDSTASSGALFTTFRAVKGLPSAPIPGCTTPTCLAAPQPSGISVTPNSAGMTASLPVFILCPAGNTAGSTNPLLPLPVFNGSCRTTSFPILYNNLIWQNRAFYIDVGPLSAQYNQSVVTLRPALSQTSIGACASGASYWDVGVRGDLSPTDHGGTGITLAPVSSVLTSLAGGYSGNHNSATNPSLARQYCNGSRVPPENGGLGYNVPPGTNEGNVPTPVFSLTAGATVDEANNWINVSWGPLALTNPANGTVLGNYSLNAGSPAIDYVTPGFPYGVAYTNAPATDFFNTPRKVPGNVNVDVGAVEGVGTGGSGSASISPTAVVFGSVVVNNNSLAQTLTLTNSTGASLTGITVTPVTTSTPTTPNVFTRPGGAAGGTCGATLANGGNCTILIVFKPVAVAAYTGTVTISASAGVIGSPVAVSGSGIAAPVRPTLGVLDNFNRANGGLGGNWGTSAITVNDVTGGNFSTGTAFCTGLCSVLGGNAVWTTGAIFGAKQGAAVTIVNGTLTNDALILDASGASALGVSTNFARVSVTATTATIATTTNFGMATTTVGTFTPAGGFANGDTITAVIDGTGAVAAPTVYVWRTRAGIDTFVGAAQIAPNALWQGGGRIGIQMPSGARLDNFAGGTVP